MVKHLLCAAMQPRKPRSCLDGIFCLTGIRLFRAPVERLARQARGSALKHRNLVTIVAAGGLPDRDGHALPRFGPPRWHLPM